MNIFKKALIVALSVGLISVPSVTKEVEAASQPETLYLTPNSNWKVDGARFAAYFFGNGEKWVSMTDADKDSTYEVSVPTDKTYPNVIFCRMNPGSSANNWNNKWNQTADLTIPTNGNNHYTVKEGTWDKGGGTWSKIVIENETPEPEPEPKAEITEWYLRGTFNEWGKDKKLEKVEDYKYSTTVTLEKASAFKVSSIVEENGWEVHFDFSDVKEGKSFVSEDKDGNMVAKDKGIYTITISYSFDLAGIEYEEQYSDKAVTIDYETIPEFDCSTNGVGSYLYFTPNKNWKDANARFAAYFFGNGEEWVSMTDKDKDGTYEVSVPTSKTYPNVIFCRMNPSTTENNWDNKWNQTSDLNLNVKGNHYTYNEGAWDSGEGTWSYNAHLKGYVQEGANGVRLVATFGVADSDLYLADDYKNVGFKVTFGENTKEAKIRYVYSSITEHDVEVFASDKGGQYFFVLTLNDIPKGTKFEFRPYAETESGTEYGAETTVYYYC